MNCDESIIILWLLKPTELIAIQMLHDLLILYLLKFYRFLWSNGPKECLEFADYTFDEHFKKPIPSFPPREVLYGYILGCARKIDMRDKIRFHTVIRSVTYSEKSENFTIVSEDLKEETKK